MPFLEVPLQISFWKVKKSEWSWVKPNTTAHLLANYCIFANSFLGNYSFLNLALCTVTKVWKLFKGRHYLRKYSSWVFKQFSRLFSWQVIIIHVLLDKLTRKNLINMCTYVITSQSYKKTWKIFFHRFSQFWEVVTVFPHIVSSLE